MAGEVDGFWVSGTTPISAANLDACLTIVGTAAEIAALSASTYKRCLAYATDSGRFYYSTGSAWTLCGIGTHTHASAGAEGGLLTGECLEGDVIVSKTGDHTRIVFKNGGANKWSLLHRLDTGRWELWDAVNNKGVLSIQPNQAGIDIYGNITMSTASATVDGVDVSALNTRVDACAVSDVTASRAFDTVYQNTTGKTLVVCVTATYDGTDSLEFVIGASSPPTGYAGYAGINTSEPIAVEIPATFHVPASWYYKAYVATGTPAKGKWVEWTMH